MKSPESPGLGHDNVVIHVEAPMSTRIQRMGDPARVGVRWQQGHSRVASGVVRASSPR